MRFEVFTLGKHFLQVHTSKGFTLFANAKLDTNGNVVSYSDKLVRRGGSWVIDTWKFLTVKYFPENPIYCAVFGFDENDTEVQVNATDIDVDSISGVNGQLVDIGNISLSLGQSLPVNTYGGMDCQDYYLEFELVDGQWVCKNFPLEIDASFSVLEAFGTRIFSVVVNGEQYTVCMDLHSMKGLSIKGGSSPVELNPHCLQLFYNPYDKTVLLRPMFVGFGIDAFQHNIRLFNPETGNIFICSRNEKIYRFII